ncbi:hypothetical protein QVD17_05329 [Tagetes erecta]|uniref:Secreted protein n=1 Tax=Tagetes erecta TaxID=13708 RepID=A0AAD8LLA1_TARER|nr:hypothetical protein QVD17_05329 [Tagetes erecta]
MLLVFRKRHTSLVLVAFVFTSGCGCYRNCSLGNDETDCIDTVGRWRLQEENRPTEKSNTLKARQWRQ